MPDLPQVLIELGEIKAMLKSHVETTAVWRDQHKDLLTQYGKELWGTDLKDGIKTDLDRIKIRLASIKYWGTTIGVTVVGILVERFFHIFLSK